MKHDAQFVRDQSVRPITIVDRPCGYGKTTEMINSLDQSQSYLICTPLLTECDRIQESAAIPIFQPGVAMDNPALKTKKDHLIQLLKENKSVVTTHAMFDQIADVAKMGLLDGYNIVIDEVLSVVDEGYRVKEKTWRDIYVGAGYVLVCPETGLVSPSPKWDEHVDQVDDALMTKIYSAAKAGRLYNLHDGINVAVMPDSLLRTGKSLTVYTYKAKGSLMLAYLNRLGLDVTHDTGSPYIEEEFRKKAQQLITVRPLPMLDGLKFSYTGQTTSDAAVLDKEVSKCLRSLRQNALAAVPLQNILVTCPIEKWFHKGAKPRLDSDGNEKEKFLPGPYAKSSRLAPKGNGKKRANWLPNTTRGTNDYRHCTHAIYLYDQHLNPNILNWIGGTSVISPDDYALTELIQWVWRTRIRDGKPITLYLPSKRMRELFLDWIWEGKVPTEVRDQIASRHKHSVPKNLHAS